MWPSYRWIRSTYRRMRSNFDFPEDYYFFHMSNMIRSNFSKFHLIFPNFPKIDGIGHHRFFCSARIFKHWSGLNLTSRYDSRCPCVASQWQARAWSPSHPSLLATDHMTFLTTCVSLTTNQRRPRINYSSICWIHRQSKPQRACGLHGKAISNWANPKA
jgi:hypothetical protein